MNNSKDRHFHIDCNGIPKISNMPKKELNMLISCLELEIRKYYIEQNSTEKNKKPP